MIERIKAARKIHRSAIEALYEDTCTIYEYRAVAGDRGRLTSKREEPVVEAQPCKLSFNSTGATSLKDGANEKAVSVKLFMAPGIEVKPGSKIVVTHEGKDTAFSNSGVPAVYNTHQEIELKLFERWT